MKIKQKPFAELMEIMKAEASKYEGYILQQGTTTQWHPKALYWPFTINQLQSHDHELQTGMLPFLMKGIVRLDATKGFILCTSTGKIIRINDDDNGGIISLNVLRNKIVYSIYKEPIIKSFIQRFNEEMVLEEPIAIQHNKSIENPVLSDCGKLFSFQCDREIMGCNLSNGKVNFIGISESIEKIINFRYRKINTTEIVVMGVIYKGKSHTMDRGVIIFMYHSCFAEINYKKPITPKLSIILHKDRKIEVKIDRKGSYIIPF